MLILPDRKRTDRAIEVIIEVLYVATSINI